MLLENRTAAIFNVSNKRSIGWMAAEALDAQGADLVIGYQHERLLPGIEKMVRALRKEPLALVRCDVEAAGDLDAVVTGLREQGRSVDCLVHSLAYAPANTLREPYVETSLEDFQTALRISAYSLVALTAAFRPCFSSRASIITMSYFGAEKVIPNYNVMGVAKAALEASVRYLAADLGPDGVRVNAISAGPVNTLAARGISGFLQMLDHHAQKAPLRRNIEGREVGDSVVFLASDLASGITGEVLHVDGGYNILGM